MCPVARPRTLVLLTNSFPYATGEEFLETEIDFLQQRFDRIVLVPESVDGPRRRLPSGVEVDPSLATFSARRSVPRAARGILAWREFILGCHELQAHPRVLASTRAIDRLRRALRTTSRVHAWALGWLDKMAPADGSALFYTYWLGAWTLGLGLALRERPAARLVSRAHGFDLYAERHRPPYIPLRSATLRMLDRLFLVSEAGRSYLLARWPEMTARCEVARLGVGDPGFEAPLRTDDVFRLATCSRLVEVKRLDLLVDGLAELAPLEPGRRIEWHHLGDGPLRAAIEAHAQLRLPRQVQCRFHGELPNREVMRFYRSQPLDVFVNVSRSEGLPVSIMEAQSCGLPVVATAVGGTPEIVTAENGMLLPADPTAGDVAQALRPFVTVTAAARAQRSAGRKTWRTLCDAERNYTRFTAQLLAVVEASPFRSLR
jgi:glycosyltransferase involved in cell wall biosynthesis